MPASDSLLPRLVELVREAGAIAQDARSDLRAELKGDVSIVTAGDRAVEQMLRPALKNLLPDSGVFGEEFGNEDEGDGGLWAVDPVDGTSNYAFGSPLWGVSVALLSGDEIVLGAVFLPDLGEMYAAERGCGATCNDSPLRSIPPGAVRPEELLSYNDRLLKAHPEIRWPGKMRCTGSFVIDAMWVARQRFRGLVGIRGKLYDVAASMLINQELGAEVRYADGTEIDLAPLKLGKTIPKPYAFLPKDAGPLIKPQAR